jgi:hypothetical protein
VSRCAKDGRWQARIRVGNTVKYLGRFRTEEIAARCYDAAFIELHGLESAIELGLNFDDSALVPHAALGSNVEKLSMSKTSTVDEEDPVHLAKIAAYKIREASYQIARYETMLEEEAAQRQMSNNSGCDSSSIPSEQAPPRRGRPKRQKTIPLIAAHKTAINAVSSKLHDGAKQSSLELMTADFFFSNLAKTIYSENSLGSKGYQQQTHQQNIHDIDAHPDDILAAHDLLFLSHHSLCIF